MHTYLCGVKNPSDPPLDKDALLGDVFGVTTACALILLFTEHCSDKCGNDTAEVTLIDEASLLIGADVDRGNIDWMLALSSLSGGDWCSLVFVRPQ